MFLKGSLCEEPCHVGKWYLVKHNCVTIGIFSGYNGQLHVSACTGHLQVVLGELKILLYAYHMLIVRS